MLEYALIKLSLGTLCYLIAAEIGGVQMRKKMIAVGTAWDVYAAFITTYASPYLLGPPNNLGAKIGWIFAGVSLASFIFVTFFVPDLHGRSLEEVDELFDRNLWAWQFGKVETVGEGRRIRELEGQGVVDQKGQVELVERKCDGEEQMV